MSQTNKAQIVIGLAVLLLGTAVYFLDRPWEQTIFVPGDLSLFPLTPSVFGVIGHSLPTFAHVFAFSLLTIGDRCFRIVLSWSRISAAAPRSLRFEAVPLVVEVRPCTSG